MSAALALTELSPRSPFLALPLAANDNDGQTVYTIYNRAGELVHVDDLTTGTKTDYVRLSGRTVARVEDKITPTYVHGDHLGSPVSCSNSAGTLLPRERYTPFGITLNNPNDLNNQAGFTGHIKDISETSFRPGELDTPIPFD